MPTPLPEGHLQNPINGERGSVFCPVIEENFRKLNIHKHSGVAGDCEQIETAAIVKSYATISSGSYVFVNDLYIQTVTLPAGFLVSTTNFSFRDTTGNEVNPTVNFISTVSISVTVNDPTLTMVVTYT